jgi:nicotinamide-nucleotide amidase
MAEGALRASGADIAVAITGIAGPDGGSPEKPVGLVHLAATTRAGDMDRIEHHFSARLGRAGIRREAARAALSLLLTLSLRHRTLA